MARFKYDIDGIERTIRALRVGVRDGMEESAGSLLEIGQDEAQDTIMRKRRVWRHEVYSSFFSDVEVQSPTKVHGTLTNYAPHAEVVNDGRTPGETAPQVQHIIEWVDDNINGGWTQSEGPDNSGGGGYNPAREEYEETPPNDYPISGPKTSQELSQEFDSVDSNWFADDPAPSGFTADNVHIGQKVIFYDEQSGNYVEGEVSKVTGKYEVEVDDGIVTYTIEGGPDGIDDKFIVAGEDWDNISEADQMEIAAREFQSIPRISTYPDYYKEEINDTIAEYMAVVDNPTRLRDMAQPINKFGTPADSPSDSSNPHVGTISSVKGQLYVAYELPNEKSIEIRSQGKKTTQRHELGHVFATSNGWGYMPGARNKNPDYSAPSWNQVQKYADDREVSYNYIEQGGPGNLVRDENEEVAPPWVYMLLTEEERDNDEYPAYEAWKDHIYEQTVVDTRVSDEPFDYDPYYNQEPARTFNVKEPTENDYIEVFDDLGGVARDTTVVDFVRLDPETRKLTVEFDDNGDVIDIRVNEDGTFDDPQFFFEKYGEGSVGVDDPSVDENDIAPDPGFQADTDLEIFREGLNRAIFRKMIAGESAIDELREEYFFHRDYSASNGQETIANFMEMFLERGDSRRTQEAIQDAAQELLDKHPDLVWATSQEFTIPSWFQDTLSNATGRDWPEIKDELDERYG